MVRLNRGYAGLIALVLATASALSLVAVVVIIALTDKAQAGALEEALSVLGGAEVGAVAAYLGGRGDRDDRG